MHIFGWIVTGVLVGLLAALFRPRRYGIGAHLLLGALAGALGGAALRTLGLGDATLGVSNVVAAALGAVAGVFALDHAIARASRRSSSAAGETKAVLPAIEARLARAAAWERELFGQFLAKPSAARDTAAEFRREMSFGDRVADRVASFGGSWPFLGSFALVLIVWIAWNLERPGGFDPYPFILLNLVLSCLAAIQAPVIMMSQNRMAAKDRLEAHSDYEVNLKAELEILALHEKIDELRLRAWADLLELQRQQIAALERLEGQAPRRDVERSA